ncbi:MAG: hypothetical protein WD042_19795 [Phycisphaeraceae bacterium]
MALAVSVAANLSAQTIPCELGPRVQSVALELYEGQDAKPVAGDVKATARVEDLSQLKRIVVEVANTGGETRFVGVRLKLTVALAGPVKFWDGLDHHADVARGVQRTDINAVFPLACLYSDTAGVAVGIDANELYSWLGRKAGPQELAYETRIVLKPGKQARLHFVAVAFESQWGYREALDLYYTTYPSVFFPHPEIDPRLWKGINSGDKATKAWHEGRYPERFRRARATSSWTYASYRRGGDIYGRPEYWEYLSTKDQVAWQAHHLHGKTDLEAFKALRKQWYDTSRQANVAQQFYMVNYSERQLAQEVYPDSIIKPLALFQSLPQAETAIQMFPWGKFGQQVREDMKLLAQEINVAGWAHDTAYGRLKYRGPLIWDFDHIAFDEEGPYVCTGVPVSLMIRHMHTLPVLGGRYKAGCEINAMDYYGANFAADHSMIEASHGWVVPYNEKDPYRQIGILAGQTPLDLHNSIRQDKTGALINWWEYSPQQIELYYRIAFEYQVQYMLLHGAKPSPSYLWGVPKMLAITDMLIDLTTRGKYAVPAVNVPQDLLTSRYGQGLRSVVVVMNPQAQTVKGAATYRGKDLSGRAPIFCEYGGGPITLEVWGHDSKAELDLKARRYLALDMIADLDTDRPGRVTGSGTYSKHAIALRIRNDAHEAIEGTWRFPRIEGYRWISASAAGKALPAQASDGAMMLKASLAPGATLQATYTSTVFLSPDTQVREFPFERDGVAQSVMVLPANADADLRQAADWISGYFAFWYEFGPAQNKGVNISVAAAPTPGGANAAAIVFEVSQAPSVSVKDNLLRFTSPDSYTLSQLVWETLYLLDKKYPLYSTFHGSTPLWNSATMYGYDKGTVTMLKAAGLWGKELHLYQGLELHELPKRTPEELRAIYAEYLPAGAK